MRQIICRAVPPSANELRRKYRHPHAYRRLREAWKTEIWYVLDRRGRKELYEAGQEHKMRVRIVLHHRRMYDPDNVVASLKPVLDSLVHLGFLHDDSATWLDLPTPTQQLTLNAKDNKTEIWIGRADESRVNGA